MWEPCITGDDRARALDVVAAIADDLERAAGDAHEVALFWAYASTHLGREQDASLDQLARTIERGFTRPELYGGAAGVGWVAAHIAEDVDDVLGAIDRILIEDMRAEPWRHSFDLINGLVGYGVYFLERGEAGHPGLERVVALLAQTATQTDDGIAWRTRPELMAAWRRERSPDGFFDCGIAHGVPGVIALLARIADRGVSRELAAELRDGAIRWLTAQRLPQNPHSAFPSIAGGRAQDTRTGWCYGDPGIAAALWRAAPSPAIVELAVACLSRPFDAGNVIDAPLCHGSAGLAHLANRLYQATRDPRFRDAARRWFDRTLEMRVPGQGIGGYRSYTAADGWHANPAFLDGSIGIALALLAAIDDDEPGWDRLMLCDL